MNLLETNIIIIRISLYIGFFFALSSLLLFVIVFINRFRLVRKEKRERAFTKKWRPILLENLYSLPKSVASVSTRDSNTFLLLLNNLHGILKGPEKEQLNHLARSLKMDQAAYRLLASRKRSRQLLGIIIMGNLREAHAWDNLVHISRKDNPTLALAALHSMAKINPNRTIQPLLSFMKNGDDWQDYKMVMVLNEIGAPLFSQPLAQMIQTLHPDKQTRFIRFMRFGDGKIALNLAKDLLHNAYNPQVIAGALNLIAIFGDARYLGLVKEYLYNDMSFIRMRAVRALAEIGNMEELPDLEKCLTDSDWWVRYRTAEAISKLPEMNNEIIIAIRDRQTDRFAVDILNYVLS